MKKTEMKERLENDFESFFEEDFSNHQISVFQNEFTLEIVENSQNEIFLDNILSLIKFVFLYIPGAMAIHFVGMFIYFFILFGLNFSEVFAGMTIGLIVGTFLTMFGIGKMSDLNYLKVPASIFAFSILISIVFSLITAFTGVQMTGTFLLLSFPITIILGYLVKNILDKE